MLSLASFQEEKSIWIYSREKTGYNGTRIRRTEIELNAKKEVQRVLPGDRLASIEEFVPGTGTVAAKDSIISTVAGNKEPDMSTRVMSVEPAKSAMKSIPRVGDYIIGLVESASPSVAQVTIKAINDVPSDREFAGMLSMREERRRNTIPLKSADLIRAKIYSTKNSIFHLSLDDPKCGVISTVCSNCGGTVVPLGRDRVKCPECGLVDDRILAEDMIRPVHSQETS
jgi:exosome complex component CSL4